MQERADQIQLPLAGVRVLDFGRYIAGPYCAALLAEYGADVIRIEKTQGSEDRYVTPVTAQGDGALFLQMNRNKRSMAFNPTSTGGREIVRKLVASADVVVANLPAKTLRSMGLAYEQLREIKRDIILTTVSAFGERGVWSDRVGFDSVAQAMCGAAYLSGHPDPARSQASWVDFGTALHCAFGTALALIDRKQRGEGQQVSGNLLSTALTFMNAQIMEQDLVAPNRPPLGNGAAGAAPIDLVQSRDGWLACHVVGQPLFERLAHLIGCPEWLDDPRFASDTLRGENREPLLAHLRKWCRERTRDEILEAFAQARIPAGPVLSLQEALDHPQSQAVGVFEEVAYEGLEKTAKLAKCPVWLSEQPVSLRPPRRLGADTDGILRSLGFDEFDIVRFREEKTI